VCRANHAKRLWHAKEVHTMRHPAFQLNSHKVTIVASATPSSVLVILIAMPTHSSLFWDDLRLNGIHACENDANASLVSQPRTAPTQYECCSTKQHSYGCIPVIR
jgi:hypothetical protein